MWRNSEPNAIGVLRRSCCKLLSGAIEFVALGFGSAEGADYFSTK